MFLSIKYTGWFMCSKIGEFEGYRAISWELLNGQVPACSQEPVDSTDANIVVTSTCLETTQQETTNFTVRLLIESDRSMFSCAPECYSSYHYKYVLQIGEWGGGLGALSGIKGWVQGIWGNIMYTSTKLLWHSPCRVKLTQRDPTWELSCVYGHLSSGPTPELQWLSW